MAVLRTIHAALLQELSCPQARGRRQGQVVSAQDLPAPAEPHRGPDQTEPLQELATAGSCYGEGDARPAKSSSGRRAASHRSQPSQQRPAGAAKQRWSYAVQGHGGGCGGSCPLQAQGRGSGALPGPTATVPAGRPFGKERTLRPPAGHGPALTANAASPAARGKTGSWESGQPSPFCITPCPWTQHLLMGLGRAAGIRCT